LYHHTLLLYSTNDHLHFFLVFLVKDIPFTTLAPFLFLKVTSSTSIPSVRSEHQIFKVKVNLSTHSQWPRTRSLTSMGTSTLRRSPFSSLPSSLPSSLLSTSAT